MINKFFIDDRQIEYSFDCMSSDVFVIKSMPYNYEVRFVDIEALSKEIRNVKDKNKANHFVFIDNIVMNLYGKQLFDEHEEFTFVAKEENKAFPIVMELIDKLQEKNFSKSNVLLSVGGGITQDVSAFVRSIFKRGIKWTYIPTTLLAMGDSCIGAKSCLNYGGIKNQLGLFSSPQQVYIYTDFLKTLDKRDVLSGYGEILKLCIVGGDECISLFEKLVKEQDSDILHNISDLIKLSLMVKKAVIEIDEYENDIRKALNYGHTIGHAIEPLLNYEIPHGIAVSIGMVIENLISVEYRSLNSSDAERINNLILNFIDKKSLDLLKNVSVGEAIESMKKDKKSSDNQISFAVPFKIGSFGILKINPDQAFNSFFNKALQIIQHSL